MHVTLFFTEGVSLRTWKDTGVFPREIALYQYLLQKGVQVSFITYGLAYDLNYQDELGKIEIRCNQKGRAPQRYGKWLPFIHAKTLFRTHIIKTNQIQGAKWALSAARIWRKPLIARCGYMWSEFAARKYGPDSEVTKQAQKTESQVFRAARQIIVTSSQMGENVAARFPELVSKVNVIPNYVDTHAFTPQTCPPEVDILFVGRLHPQKNLHNLLEAIRPLHYSLRIIGSGPLESDLKSEFRDLNERVEWLGNVPHYELPNHFCRARLYVLPSQYEGHPKTLIEAMACGRPIIGTQVTGIKEVIEHGNTGWLCGTSAGHLREAIELLLSDTNLQETLAQNARQFAVAHYDLQAVAERELSVYQTIGT